MYIFTNLCIYVYIYIIIYIYFFIYLSGVQNRPATQLQLNRNSLQFSRIANHTSQALELRTFRTPSCSPLLTATQTCRPSPKN